MSRFFPPTNTPITLCEFPNETWEYLDEGSFNTVYKTTLRHTIKFIIRENDSFREITYLAGNQLVCKIPKNWSEIELLDKPARAVRLWNEVQGKKYPAVELSNAWVTHFIKGKNPTDRQKVIDCIVTFFLETKGNRIIVDSFVGNGTFKNFIEIDEGPDKGTVVPIDFGEAFLLDQDLEKSFATQDSWAQIQTKVSKLFKHFQNNGKWRAIIQTVKMLLAIKLFNIEFDFNNPLLKNELVNNVKLRNTLSDAYEDTNPFVKITPDLLMSDDILFGPSGKPRAAYLLREVGLPKEVARRYAREYLFDYAHLDLMTYLKKTLSVEELLLLRLLPTLSANRLISRLANEDEKNHRAIFWHSLPFSIIKADAYLLFSRQSLTHVQVMEILDNFNDSVVKTMIERGCLYSARAIVAVYSESGSKKTLISALDELSDLTYHQAEFYKYKYQHAGYGLLNKSHLLNIGVLFSRTHGRALLTLLLQYHWDYASDVVAFFVHNIDILESFIANELTVEEAFRRYNDKPLYDLDIRSFSLAFVERFTSHPMFNVMISPQQFYLFITNGRKDFSAIHVRFTSPLEENVRTDVRIFFQKYTLDAFVVNQALFDFLHAAGVKNFCNSIFSRVDLSHKDLSDCDFTGVIFKDVICTQMIINRNTHFKRAFLVDTSCDEFTFRIHNKDGSISSDVRLKGRELVRSFISPSQCQLGFFGHRRKSLYITNEMRVDPMPQDHSL